MFYAVHTNKGIIPFSIHIKMIIRLPELKLLYLMSDMQEMSWHSAVWVHCEGWFTVSRKTSTNRLACPLELCSKMNLTQGLTVCKWVHLQKTSNNPEDTQKKCLQKLNFIVHISYENGMKSILVYKQWGFGPLHELSEDVPLYGKQKLLGNIM